jgi:oligopeptide transport system ATP-binding protein
MLEVRDLVKDFPVRSATLFSSWGLIRAVDGVSFNIRKGETLGLVGESGCGKTTVARCILQLERPTSGLVTFDGQGLTQLEEVALRRIRRSMQIIFQDPYSSLNPRMTVGQIIGEPLKVHRILPSQADRAKRVAELLHVVGLRSAQGDRYARALALEPSFIVCDEPVSALDVSIQAQIINLLEELQERFALTYLFISHDLSVVRHISDRIAVMYLGKMVEVADRQELYENPQHPYTKALLSAVPIPDPALEAGREPIVLKGEVPSPLNPPSGCVFHPRCPIAISECQGMVPDLREVRPGHWAACIRV